jgi:hypothetical protein
MSQLTTTNLNIATGSKLIIDTTAAVTVTNSLTNNVGTLGLIIKANAISANVTLIFSGTSPLASVEMYSNSSWVMVGSTPTSLKWQFFGLPIQILSSTSPTFNGAYVRRYNEAGNGSGTSPTNRWIQLSSGSAMQHTNGYEVVQAAAKTYTFRGQLYNENISRTLSYTPSADYPGQHILGNPYTAAIDITQIQFGDSTEASVYQYNTGSFADWQNSSGGAVSGNSPGQYIVSTKNTAGDLGIPRQIPSMQGFLIKAMKQSSLATFNIPYSSTAMKNTDRQRTKAVNPEKCIRLLI